MRVGFKTGPGTFEEGRRIVDDEGADLCEIWFNVTDLEPYDEVFDWLLNKGVAMGLHHWGLVDGKYKTNLMAADEHIRDASIEQMKQTIDIASEVSAVYVNVHPGARMIEEMDFTTATQQVAIDMPVSDIDKARTLLLSAASELYSYAKKAGILLTIETLPGMETGRYKERKGPYSAQSASLADLEAVAAQGGFVANDVTHTAGQVALENNTPSEMWSILMEFTRRVQKQTKLLHINTVTPPYDGTDSHGGILDTDFETERFPEKEQLKDFLGIFSERDDIFVIPEPHADMQGNFRVLRNLVSSL